MRLLMIRFTCYISIHALRGEGDEEQTMIRCIDSRISIHALRGEGDVVIAPSTPAILKFQSTPSVGRATNMD